jgi:hypothetical protein
MKTWKKFVIWCTGHKHKVDMEIRIRPINNGYLVGDQYCATKDEVVGFITKVVRSELDGAERT